MSAINIFIGVLLLQVIFIIYQLIIFRRQEFVWYLFYSITLAVYIVFQAEPALNPIKSTITQYEKFTLNRGCWFLFVAFYFRFGMHFCNMPHLYPRHTNILKMVTIVMFTIGSADIITSYLHGGFYFSDKYMLWIILVISAFSLYIIVFLGSKKVLFNRILVSGSMCLLAFGLMALADMKLSNHSKSGLHYMTYHMAGATLEFLFLNYGLILKSKMIEKEKNRLELLQEVLLLKERERILADLHDDVGGGLSSIRIMSDLLKNKAQGIQQTERFAEKISYTVREVSQKMNTIIWALNPENDTLQNFSEYIRQYAVSYFEGTPATIHFSGVGLENDTIVIHGNKRKMLFLCVKEILHNSLKYAQASAIEVGMELKTKSQLVIRVADNGIGIGQTNPFGNGLKNIRKRMDEINGTADISGQQGTCIILTVDLH